jgi:hypothetical protein
VGPKTGLDDVETLFLTLPGLELRPLCRPARRQSLSRLLLKLILVISSVYKIKSHINFISIWIVHASEVTGAVYSRILGYGFVGYGSVVSFTALSMYIP